MIYYSCQNELNKNRRTVLLYPTVQCEQLNLPFQCDELPKVISLMIVNVAFLTHYLIGLSNWIVKIGLKIMYLFYFQDDNWMTLTELM